jgi:transposase
MRTGVSPPAKKDQLRARHRLGKFLLRDGRRPPTAMTPWTQRHLGWVKGDVHFEQPAQEATLLDYLHEVDHAAARIERLDRAIDNAVTTAPPQMRAVIDALQALRGIAKVSAVMIVAELGRALPVRTRAPVDGLRGPGRARGFQRPADAAGRHHQDRQRSPPPHCH